VFVWSVREERTSEEGRKKEEERKRKKRDVTENPSSQPLLESICSEDEGAGGKEDLIDD